MIDWGAILAEHGPTVWRTVYRLLNHHDDALDCYQETFLTAFRFTHSHRVEDWSAFLVSVATRRAMDRLRQRCRSGRRSLPLDAVPEPASEVDGPVQQARADELMQRVREKMAELPEKQAEVFWLSCLEGLAHRQVADLMEVPLGEVRVLLHRARTRLGTALNLDQLHERGTQ
jgi:RNA polymerase sigma-70 factor (ECF subfamily)